MITILTILVISLLICHIHDICESSTDYESRKIKEENAYFLIGQLRGRVDALEQVVKSRKQRR